MRIESFAFDGRCPDCGSEELLESESINGDTITTCSECGEQFMVVVDINEAIYY